MSTLYNIIKRPVITEKTTQSPEGTYVFEVDLNANKHVIREAVEKLFGVKVESVNTTILAGKRKRFGRTVGKRSNRKKAIVKLADGQAIEFFGNAAEVEEVTE